MILFNEVTWYLLNFREKRHNQQEDDLFSTYESLKAHASPSPPPALLWTDLSKDEKKTLGKAKSPCSMAATKTFVVKAEKAGIQVRITKDINDKHCLTQ